MIDSQLRDRHRGDVSEGTEFRKALIAKRERARRHGGKGARFSASQLATRNSRYIARRQAHIGGTHIHAHTNRRGRYGNIRVRSTRSHALHRLQCVVRRALFCNPAVAREATRDFCPSVTRSERCSPRFFPSPFRVGRWARGNSTRGRYIPIRSNRDFFREPRCCGEKRIAIRGGFRAIFFGFPPRGNAPAGERGDF